MTGDANNCLCPLIIFCSIHAAAENEAVAEGRVLLVSFFNSLEHYLSSTYMTPFTDGEIAVTLFSQLFGTLMFTILYGIVISSLHH